MRYRIVAVGRRAQDPLVEATDKYLERLRRYTTAELLLVRDSNSKSEGEALLAKLTPEDFVVVLDERGDQRRTIELAQQLDELPSHRRITFLVGGADGHSDAVRSRANRLLALSKFTLPHRLVWVMLIEQLYRAHTILRGEAYHRE